jgi:hypothetical protein
MRQGAHQQLRARKAMPQRGFQFGKNGFHLRLDPIKRELVSKTSFVSGHDLSRAANANKQALGFSPAEAPFHY